MTTIVIPWRGTRTERANAKSHVIRKLREILPNSLILLADSGHQPFNRAASRNRGVNQADAGVVVICDADTIPDREPLLEAIEEAGRDGLLHLPYTQYRALSPAGTAAALSGTPLAECAIEITGDDSQGGVLVMDAEAWNGAGGMDERFTGWGFEDTAFYMAARTLCGDVVRHEGNIHHLWHPSDLDMRSSRYAANKAHCRNYEAAYGNPAAMRRVQRSLVRQ